MSGQRLRCIELGDDGADMAGIGAGMGLWRVWTYAGDWRGKDANWNKMLFSPAVVCADPLKPFALYIGEMHTISYWDGQKLSNICYI